MKKVLLIEDDYDLASAMIEELKHSLFSVTHVASSNESTQSEA